MERCVSVFLKLYCFYLISTGAGIVIVIKARLVRVISATRYRLQLAVHCALIFSEIQYPVMNFCNYGERERKKEKEREREREKERERERKVVVRRVSKVQRV